MKRLLEEVDGVVRSKFKKPFRSCCGARKVTSADTLAFLGKVKERFFLHHQIDKYWQFIRIMKKFKSQTIGILRLKLILKKLFEGHNDLIVGFNAFLPDGYKINEATLKMQTCVDFLNKIKNSFDDDDRVYKSFLDAMNRCRKDRAITATVCLEVAALFRNHTYLLDEFVTFLPDDDDDVVPAESDGDPSFILQHDHDVDHGYCKSIYETPSTSSENSKHYEVPKTAQESIMFECEDDRYEMDMLLNTVRLTVKHVEELLQSINLGIPIRRIEDKLTATNLRCVEQIYGDYGLSVIDILHKNPNQALPIILPRLKQKEDEWTRARSELNKIWAEVYAKNLPLQDR